MPTSGILRHEPLVRTDVSEEPTAYIIRVTRIGELGATLAKLATDARCEEIQSSYGLILFLLYRFLSS
jgi:hypothetical protein